MRAIHTHRAVALALTLLAGGASAQTLDARTLMGAQVAPAGDEAAGRAAFERGVGQAEQLQWSAAAESFEESYRLYPRVATLRNLGLAHRALGRFTSAIDELGRFLAEGLAPDEVRGQLQGLIDGMRVQLATLTVIPSVEGAALRLDGAAITAREPRTADPGDHVLEATAEGYNRNAQTLRLARGERRELAVTLQRTEGGVLTRWWFWTIIGVAVAGATTAAVLLLSEEAPPDCGTLQLCLSP